MSERSSTTSWITKRKRAAATQMRELKEAVLPTSEHSRELTPSSNNLTSSGSSATLLPEPTSSSSDPTSLATVHPDPSDDESSIHSESQNKRMAWKVQVTKTGQTLTQRKLKVFLITGSLVFH